MTLGEKQRRFTELLGRLITWVYARGWELTLGEALRTDEQAAINAAKGIGISKSLHRLKLAIDLNLFIEGIWQTNPDAYREMGAYWKSLDPANRWGGDFKMKDAVHFSMEHEGVQ